MVLGAGAALAGAGVMERSGAEALRGGRTVYTCPMHREVRAAAAGACPLCGMDLEPLVDRSDAFLSAAAAHPEIGSAMAQRLLYSAELRAPARVVAPGVVEAHVNRDEVAIFAHEDGAAFAPGASPAVRAEVRAIDGAAALWDETTSALRFSFAGRADLPVGTAGWVSCPSSPRPALMMPAGGVLQSSGGAYVVVLGDRGSFEKRPIEMGKVLNRNAFVVSGLAEHERVAVNAAFPLDAERRSRGGSRETSVVR